MSFEYKRIITDEEEKILHHELLDIKDWIDKAIEGRINHSFKVAAREYDEFAKKNGVSMVPADTAAKVQAYFSDPKYKDRTAREAETQQNFNTITQDKGI